MTFPADSNSIVEMYKDAIGRATARQMSVIDLFKVAATLDSINQRALAIEIYKAWIAFNADNDLLYAVYYNYGVVLTAIEDRTGAINALRECTRLKPDFQQ